MSEPPSAIIAYNDIYAVHLIKAALEMNLNIPGDLSIVGSDNMEAGRYCTPALTTAEQNRAALG